jgi:hypothetical protein
VQISVEQVLEKFGDYRSFIYQIRDDLGMVFWQEEIYLRQGLANKYMGADLSDISDAITIDAKEGYFKGEPHLLSISEVRFFPPGENFYLIEEPPGGFYSLSFNYNISAATGLTGSSDLVQLADELVYELFPYQVNGLYSGITPLKLEGEISGASGLLQVYFPHHWLDQTNPSEEKYMLRISHRDGTLIQQVNLLFIPYPMN